MPATAEPLTSSAHEEKHFEGARLVLRKPETEHPVEAEPEASAGATATPPDPTEDLPIQHVIRVLRSSVQRHAANISTRFSAAWRVQKTHGNRALQGIILRAPDIRRDGGCGGKCAKCQE